MWRLFKWCGWLILIGAAACAPAIAPNATQSPLASTSPLAPPPAVDSWVIRYHRSGGIAGVDETWTIFADGKVQYAGKGAEGPMQIAPDQMNALIAAIRAADFTSLKDSYVPANQCCDRFTYEITTRIDGQLKTVRTLDAAPDEPPALSQLLEQLNAVLQPAQ